MHIGVARAASTSYGAPASFIHHGKCRARGVGIQRARTPFKIADVEADTMGEPACDGPRRRVPYLALCEIDADDVAAFSHGVGGDERIHP